jgi:hypothetical protein
VVLSSVWKSHPDNIPDLTGAIELGDLDNGNEATLEEKPHNGLEVSPGGPFILRVLHQRQVSILIMSK